MDDPRIEWLRNRVYQALDIQDLEVFEELLERDDGEVERCLLKYLNDTPDESESSILFYKVTREEEEEVEVECGMLFFSPPIKAITDIIILSGFPYFPLMV